MRRFHGKIILIGSAQCIFIFKVMTIYSLKVLGRDNSSHNLTWPTRVDTGHPWAQAHKPTDQEH